MHDEPPSPQQPPPPGRAVLTAAIGGLAVLCGLSLPFLRTARGAPFVPSTPAAVSAVVAHARSLDLGRAPRLVDLGSSSGSVVFAAAAAGADARGVERNAVLVGWCWARAAGGAGGGRARFTLGDMWGAGVGGDDVVVVFGVPGVMEGIAEKCASEMRDGAWLASNTFEVPGWRCEKVVSGVRFYQKGGGEEGRRGLAGIVNLGSGAALLAYSRVPADIRQLPRG